MHRHKAVDVLNDKINVEGSGNEEWLGCTKSNISFNPTRLRLSLINIGCWDLYCVESSAGGLIRALDSCCMVRLKVLS
jgi:hypothetical protein